MTKPADNPADPFKKALAEATKVMANDRELNVTYTVDPSGVSGETMRLPQVTRRMAKEEVLLARGVADALALRHRFHDAATHARFAPPGEMARALYEAMETARCEAMGARVMPGTASNIDHKLADEAARRGYHTMTSTNDAPLAEAAGYFLRQTATGRPLPPGASNVLDLWRGFIEGEAGDTFQGLDAVLDNQAAFARFARQVIDDLGYGDQLGDDPDAQDENEEQDAESEEDSANEDEAQDQEGEEDDSEAQPDQSQEPQDDQSEAQVTVDDLSELESGEESELPEADMPPELPPLPPASEADPNYTVYDDAHDEEIKAEDLAEAAELERLRNYLDQQLEPLKGAVSRLANKLQRRLQAQQNRSWEFDLEEGILDAGRLARVVANPTTPLSFKVEKDTEFRDTVVTLLIDNSGSMRGKPIETACITADIVAAALERCSISTEILGFTTAAWNGGASAKEWKAAGRPEAPGRLNDLLHIVYKSPDTPLRRARDMLSAMLSPALLKENVDGEALIWAADRMLRRPEARKFLIVISDGAPVDKATIDANDDKALLDRHLRGAIGWITRETPIDLAAIGLKHEVAEYYRNSVRIDNVEDLATTVISLIDTALVSR
ncbi:MAG: cobaltochelatase subunit CobT [Maritimibacter sp.]|nr:cobaltochelatase subunit CobT [Maritimibacter sp.]